MKKESNPDLVKNTPAINPLTASLPMLLVHDFRNIMLSIRNSAETLRGQAHGSAAMIEEVDQILESVDKARSLIETIQSVSTPVGSVIRALDLNEEIIKLHPVVARLLGVSRGLQLELNPRTPSAQAVERLLDHALTSLFDVAGQTVPAGATIVIRTFADVVHESDKQHFLSAPPPDEQTRAIVEIAGAGVASADERWTNVLRTWAGRLDPHGIVMMAFRPSDIQGVVRFYFPLAIASSAAPVSLVMPGNAAPPERGHETVLVAEDDAGARRVISRILTSHGYHVLEAGNGASAIRTLLNHEGKVDLLLADVMMPDFDGPALAQQVSGLRPGIKVIYASGFDASALDRQDIALWGESVSFMKKPFRREELLSLVRRTLDA